MKQPQKPALTIEQQKVIEALQQLQEKVKQQGTLSLKGAGEETKQAEQQMQTQKPTP